MPNVVHFEICVGDLGAAANFYSSVFGWKMEEVYPGSNYLYVTTGEEDDPGISGGLTNRIDDYNTTINTIEVPSVDLFARKVVEAGGRIYAPKIPIPRVGYVQYCYDIEGNAFGILEYDDLAQ